MTPGEGGRGRHGGTLLVVAVLVVGVAASLAAFAGLLAAQNATAERVMQQRAVMARAAVQSETARYTELLTAAAAGLSVDNDLTWDGFDTDTLPLARAGLIGAPSMALVVPAYTAQVAAVQREWRARGADGLTLQPAAGLPEHFFTVFTRPLGNDPAQHDGLDLATAGQPAEALRQSRLTFTTTVSDTYVLLRDRGLPAARQQHSFVFAAPIWTRAPDAVFRGWLVLGLRGQDFLRGVLSTVSQGQLDGMLVATNADRTRPAVASYAVPGKPDLSRRLDVDVADQRWTLILSADRSRLPGAHGRLPLIVLLGGLALTATLAGLALALATGGARAWRRVQEATAELRAAEAEARHQAELQSAIMTSIGDGVGVVDETGAFLLHNPAARDLLGIGEEVDDPDAWQEYYGLYLPDNRTPFPQEQLPLIRALAGEATDGVEMIVRNPGRPEGVLISVDGRPLDASAGRRGAVAVFHDITDLRRYETDLALFAGVVAHDLKAPLAVVLGYCETASDALEDSDAASARSSLDRIVRAVDRMTSLIDTLLGYSTARDAPLHLRTVDLGAVVADAVQERAAALAELPAVTIGELPPVRADPAMLRHVLDNLIGNALKYVRPGTAPTVAVTASRAANGWVLVTVADRGIGIPDAEKPDVFERFHRAAGAAGYAGTGLGLAICRRIVQRHGGEISVTDNPGGGSRFTFTLPRGETMPDDDDEARKAREALERALAQRAEMEGFQLPEPEPRQEPAVAMPRGQNRLRDGSVG